MQNNTQGFTLIELLIVIAIIGILAAVLIPNLLGAQARAYDTAASSCANSLAKAVNIWKIDNPNNVAVPAAANLMTEANADDYGTTNCRDGSITVTTTASGGPDWEYNVVHAQGKNQYDISATGLESSAKPAKTE